MPKSKDFSRQLKAIRMLVCDVDGVLTDGGIIWDEAGREIKRFSVLDGVGFILARLAGLEIAFLSARKSKVVTHRAEECSVKWVSQGIKNKGLALEQLCQQTGIPPSAVAYIGDDLIDLPVFQQVGLAIAVANAIPEVKRAAHWITRTPGGEGVAREVIERILQAQKCWDRVLAAYHQRNAAKN